MRGVFSMLLSSALLCHSGVFAQSPSPLPWAGGGADPCLDVLYADKNYKDCCGHGNYKKQGHQSICHELQKERREEGEAANIDFHKEPPESKARVIAIPLYAACPW